MQKDSEKDLNEDKYSYGDTETGSESDTESTSERTQHRRLLAVNPNPTPAPTGKLDQLNIEKYDFTTQKLDPFQFEKSFMVIQPNYVFLI